MSSDPIRTALERLIEAINGIELEGVSEVDDAIAAALAALAAAPEGEPSGEELTLTYARAVAAAVDGKRGSFNREDAERAQLAGLRAVYARWGRPATPPAPTTKELKELEGWLQEMLGSPSAAAAAQWETNIKYLSRFLRMADSAFLRQQLLQQENHRFREPERTILCDILANGTLLPDPDGTRYGIPAAPPAPLEGEVGELVVWLEETGHLAMQADAEEGERYFRTATLLQQLPAPAPAVVPVAVSERLPGPEDCDAEGRCWRWNSIGGHWAKQPLGRKWYEFESHWLPAHAIPLPAPQGGEVKE